MANGSIITNSGKNIILHRIWTTNSGLGSTYKAPTKFGFGIDNGTPSLADTDLDKRIPITNGTTIDTCEDTWTGSSGGDNSTDNTTTYKEGGNETDDTAQNLIANGTSVSKVWTLAQDTALDDAKYFGFWIYIIDAAALAKFLTSGTAFEFRIRTNGDGATLFYSITRTAAQLAVGWNWITTGSTVVGDLTQGAGGAPSGTLDEVVVIVTTNNSTDTLAAGDLIIDHLRQWEASDLIISFSTNYPTIDYTNNEVTIRTLLNSTVAQGFLISGIGIYNEDSTPLLFSEDTITGESKSRTDEFAIVTKERVI